MANADHTNDPLLASLRERAKELNCLYRVDEILNRTDEPIEEVFRQLLDALPLGWQFPEVCVARIEFENTVYEPPGFEPSSWVLETPILVHGVPQGTVAVYYTEDPSRLGGNVFLEEEQRLIRAIAERISFYLLQRQLRMDRKSWESAVQGISSKKEESWKVLLKFLARTDRQLLQRLGRKMVYYLSWNEIAEAEALLQEEFPDDGAAEGVDENRPLARREMREGSWTDRVFEIASHYFPEEEILASLQGWINEENSTFLIKSLENPGTGLAELSEAVARFQSSSIEEEKLSPAVRTSLKVALLRRFFVDQLDFINVAKKQVDVKDFYELAQHLIYPARSQGRLGGKGAGLFLAARILEKSPEAAGFMANVRFPKTWFVASDGILDFIQHNTLSEVYNQKYQDIERVRQDYPRVIQVFKNSRFTPEMEKGFAAALDDFEDRPLIVRSSSILEDRVGSSFSGKYKSLFLANQGTKRERMEALKDAVAEVYASVFGPDPIEYRAERKLIDYREEMGILIQEVVGTRVGRYFLPTFAGVAFSNNEFRWSPRLKREDGLLRMVPGLGTRAVDRVADDYPVLLSPGNPGLRVNVTSDEILRYSPRRMDVIDIEENRFTTVDVDTLLREHGEDLPGVRRMISILDGDRLHPPRGLEPDWAEDTLAVTFEGLVEETDFMVQVKTILDVLREGIGGEVDLEFAHDGTDFYILQCRSQSNSRDFRPAAIPRNLPAKKVLFGVNRYVSNGHIPDVSHIVYVDPGAYAALPERKDLLEIGRIIGRLNNMLPKHKFILIGPGRWGSRGDIRLGVNVTYSDINNTALLMEVASRKGNYVPELSFGTHFFQDLVEAGIRYLPVYLDDPATVFQESFFRLSHNLLPELIPGAQRYSDVVRVIDVPSETGGDILQVLLNADLDEAVGVLTRPRTEARDVIADGVAEPATENHWWWRMRMARKIARHLAAPAFGVEAIWVFGSTKNAIAGAGSDIDLIIHFKGTEEQRAALGVWLEGWSQALAEMNYLRTGYRSDGLLDVHYITDRDILEQTSFAAKIDAVTDAAWPLRMGLDSSEDDEDTPGGAS